MSRTPREAGNEDSGTGVPGVPGEAGSEDSRTGVPGAPGEAGNEDSGTGVPGAPGDSGLSKTINVPRAVEKRQEHQRRNERQGRSKIPREKIQ